MRLHTILVVEDEGIVALDLKRQLLHLGYEPVAITDTAEDAIRLAGKLRPELVLMDISLAGAMDGIQAATIIRERFSIPSIFLTAYATNEIVERAKAAEPLGYIIKPFDEYNLRTSIEIALHKDRLDRQLRESEARYRVVAKSAALQTAALRAAANAIVITDRAGTIEWVNPAFSVLTGFSEVEAVGRNPSELVRSGVHDPAFYAQMWQTIRAGRVWEGEITNRRKDGSLCTELQTITPVLDETGEITHFVGIKHDLTTEKRLQAQFLQAQKMEVVGRLAGGIAHDFNNLLTVINGETDLALENLAADAPLRKPLEAILDAGERAARLTKQLLTFSRKHVATPTVMSVGEQLGDMASIIRRLIGEDIKLSLDLGDRKYSDRVNIDRGQFEQVILNLAVNARDAMPSGGSLKIQVRATAGEVLVAVTDSGTGIAPEVRARLFEPFFTTKPQGKGTGLGLATVFAVVTQNGGTLDVESAVGHGATFKVFLPVVATEAAEPGADKVPHGAETIVLVEDEDDTREVTARMLRAAGYHVIPMSSSPEALAWFGTNKQSVQLLMSDVVMPDLTGPELAKALSSLCPRMPVLFSSGYTDDKLTADALADPDRFIAKPFCTGSLARKVRHILDSTPAA